MTVYRLPDWLGGHQVNVVATRGDGQLICVPSVPFDDDLNRTEVHIGRRYLVKAGPPLPPEPEDRARKP